MLEHAPHLVARRVRPDEWVLVLRSQVLGHDPILLEKRHPDIAQLCQPWPELPYIYCDQEPSRTTKLLAAILSHQEPSRATQLLAAIDQEPSRATYKTISCKGHLGLGWPPGANRRIVAINSL